MLTVDFILKCLSVFAPKDKFCHTETYDKKLSSVGD